MNPNRARIEDIYPLSPMQQGMLFHSLREPDAGLYVEQTSWLIEADLAVEAFRQAWSEAVRRHSILRTSFAWDGLDEPMQVVHRSVELPFAFEDLRTLPASEREAVLAGRERDLRSAGFDLARPPLMRLSLFRLDERSFVFVWTHHHVLLDGWSVPLLLFEVVDSYRALAAGGEPRSRLIRPYRDYIAWLRGKDPASAREFWTRELAGFEAPTRLPAATREGNGPAAAAPSSIGGSHRVLMSRDLTSRMESLCRREGVTLSTLLHGAWGLVLARHAGEADVVFGSTVSGRPADLAGSEGMVGLFINTLPVRVRVDEGAEVGEWLRGLQGKLAELRAYEYSPLVEVQGWSEVPRGRPLFETLFVFENYPVQEKEAAGGLEVRERASHSRTNFPLTVAASPGAELGLEFSCDGELYDVRAIERLAGRFERLLEDIAGTATRVRDVGILPEPEARTILETWSRGADREVRARSFHELVEGWSEATPGAVAVVGPTLGTCGEAGARVELTYGDLEVRANRVAAYLRSLGV
ncbi:MAG: condensation domain-containing protein, partial [Gemmatimonadota bacterium]